MAKKKASRKKPKTNRLKDLYAALEQELTVQLEVRRLAHRNAEAKGDASEDVWLELLADHLPHRYRVAKGIIIDADGRESHYIDIVYDRQYTPLVFNENGTIYIPAESVYAVLEAKQDLTRANIIYAGKKAASVRRLRRTDGRIVDARGGKRPQASVRHRGRPRHLRAPHDVERLLNEFNRHVGVKHIAQGGAAVIGAATPCVYYVCSPRLSCGSCGSRGSIF
jgi:hypothetical protein